MLTAPGGLAVVVRSLLLTEHDFIARTVVIVSRKPPVTADVIRSD